ncbi:murein L,D-transpeptidase [Companilactobacillus suantsaicola]|uniref:Murein L,D-transpeptidase n=1 Tax=Companilactobacillus suantsaicola TaxID=2487723 RepID=A0A4Z0JLK9_9LACO|nr:L,D-transpeptidase [Companilactobacillus suantsaicola]TGD22916.1 murein L,D-transpeptidase [Companilactobacillus suantsaicola]
MNKRGIYTTILVALTVIVLGAGGIYLATNNSQSTKVEAQDQKSKPKPKKKAPKKKISQIDKDDKDMVPLKKFKYTMSSEKKAYPNLQEHPNAWIDVDITTQRVYIMDGKTQLYEMYASTGEDDATPKGTFHIEPERGEFFYTKPLKLGAFYWVSFKDHGVYLFHTSPTDVQGNYVESIAKTLGKKPSSHGCIHLSTPDCKWIYENVPTNMTVKIHGTFNEARR